MISELVFEHIEGNFWYAAYGPFRVIMMKDTGYINATKLCSSGGKQHKDWIRNKAGQEIVQALERKMAHENTHAVLESSDLTLRDSSQRIIGELSLTCKIHRDGRRPDLVPGFLQR